MGNLTDFILGQVKWFAQSSGTTSNSVKHIPITRDSLKNCHYKGGKDLLSLYYHENPKTQLFQGKHLIAGGSSTFIGNKKTVIGDLCDNNATFTMVVRMEKISN